MLRSQQTVGYNLSAMRRPTFSFLFRMAIYRLIKHSGAYGPEAIKVMTDAYAAVLRSLKLTDRTDPVTEIVARRILDVHKKGLNDPKLIEAEVLRQLL
jgi:hypothetical protein